jgi:hypothetical protein
VLKSHVRGGTPDWRDALGGGGRSQPSNQLPELHGSVGHSCMPCLRAFCSTYTRALRTTFGVVNGLAK